VEHVNAPHAQTTSWVAQRLRECIESGLLLPGSKLAEQKLAEELDVSRNTLREAFTVLVAHGLVQRIPNRGVFVASPGAEGVREIYAVRRTVEPSALLWSEAGPGVLATMRSVVNRAQEARDRADVPAMAAANQELHRMIVALAGSETIAEMMERVLARMRLVFFAMQGQPDFHTHYVELNVRLVTLLEQGRRAEAAEAMRSYLDVAEAELLGHLERDGETRDGEA
jgi:DNA-binding GntR family transcriptional regulator